jgi:hypothetical protein
VTNAASFEHNQRTAPAISSGLPMRPTGSCAMTRARPSSVSPVNRDIIGVSMIPGHKALILMFLSAYSKAAALLIQVTPNFEAQ